MRLLTHIWTILNKFCYLHLCCCFHYHRCCKGRRSGENVAKEEEDIECDKISFQKAISNAYFMCFRKFYWKVCYEKLIPECISYFLNFYFGNCFENLVSEVIVWKVLKIYVFWISLSRRRVKWWLRKLRDCTKKLWEYRK